MVMVVVVEKGVCPLRGKSNVVTPLRCNVMLCYVLVMAKLLLKNVLISERLSYEL